MALFNNVNKTTTGQTGLTTTNGTQTGSVTNGPYGPATGLLGTALGKLGKTFGTGQLSPYTPMNTQQNQGLQQSYGIAKWLQPYLNNAVGVAGGMANGSGDISSAPQTTLGNAAMGPSYAEQYLGGVANGSQIGGNDPNFERLLAKAKADAATEAGMVASNMGRTGSDYHQTQVADTVGNLEASQRLARLQDQENRQMQAIGAMESGRMGNLGAALNAFNSASGIQGANQDRRFSATNAIPGLSQAALLPGQTMTNVGNIRQADAALKKAGPGQNLGVLAQLLGQFTNGLGTQQTSGTQSGTAATVNNGFGTEQGPNNDLAKILGLGVGGASLLKQLSGLPGFSFG